MVKCLPTMRETWVQSLGWEDPLEKENGNPLQYSCLGDPRDRGAWQATVHGEAKSQTQLSDFTSNTRVIFFSYKVQNRLHLCAFQSLHNVQT